MKLKKLTLNNFAKFTNIAVEFDNKVTRLIGFNGAGKTTLGCTAIWACLKGISEKISSGGIIGERFRFIGNNGRSSDIELQLFDESTNETITCKNHITKDSNKITFTSENGRQLTNDWLNGLFNHVFMSAKSFCQLSSKDQALKLGIDVSKFDAEIKLLKQDYTILNREYKAFGDLVEPENVKPVDIEMLKLKKQIIKEKFDEQYLANVMHNRKLRAKYDADLKAERKKNQEFNTKQADLQIERNEISGCMYKLRKYGYDGEELTTWFASLPIPKQQILDTTTPEPQYVDEMPDDSKLRAIDDIILNANAVNQKASVYAEYLKAKAKKEEKEKALTDNKTAQAAKEKEKLDYITSFKFGFTGLSVDEDGGLLLNGKPIKDPYFSKGELEVIVAKIALNLNPEWKTRFIDDFELLDEPNQEKILNDLLSAGFQVITAEIGEKATREGSIVLKDCKVVDNEDSETVSLF